jgi:LmbE family N-acetylglucosaminyl deacetylase
VAQEAVQNLTELTRRILAFLQQSAPEVVLTHAYEGGHPDHDATAFAVHAGVKLMMQNGLKPPTILEMALHPSSDWCLKVPDFLPSSAPEITTLVLDKKSRELKRQMYECFRSQGTSLVRSPIGPEKFRRPLHYDFSLPPQEGRVLYETFPCAFSGRQWQSLATKALRDLFSGKGH